MLQAQADVAVGQQTAVEFLASSSGSLQLGLNGQSVYHREDPRDFRIDSDRFPATLSAGNNRLVVSIADGSADSRIEFHLRFRRKSALAQHERLAQAVLARPGDPARGRAVFLNTEKSLCLNCHRMNDQGERIGPELTSLGSRFSRIYIAESILEPSRAIAPSFGAWQIVLQNGQILSGVKVAESESSITLADNRGQKQIVATNTIEEQIPSLVSIMPDGLEKRISEQEFVDLVAFLASLKEEGKP